jgi:hypothetical protein
MSRNFFKRCVAMLLLGGACLVTWLVVPAMLGTTARAADQPPTSQPTNTLSVKGTCRFGGKESTWSAKLTPKGDGTYDADYDSTWGSRQLKYVGTIKTDLKTEISGTGKAKSGAGNGTFEFSGKFGEDGVAQCTYTEVGGGRKGTLTAEMPK